MLHDENVNKKDSMEIEAVCCKQLKKRGLLSKEYKDLLNQELKWLDKDERITKFRNFIKICQKVKELKINHMTNIMGSLSAFLLDICPFDPVANKLYPSNVFFRQMPSYCLYIPLHLVELINMRLSMELKDISISLLKYQYIEKQSKKKVKTYWVASSSEEKVIGFEYDKQISKNDSKCIYLMGFPKLSSKNKTIKINKKSNALYGEDFAREISSQYGLTYAEINHLAKVACRSSIDSFASVLKKYNIDSKNDEKIKDLQESLKKCLQKHYWATLLE